MSGYTAAQTGTIKFDGQDVGYKLRRLTVAEAMEAKRLNEVEMDAFTKERLLHLDPIPDADGNPVSLDTIFGDWYFSKLCSALSLALFQTGDIPKAKADPSAGSLSAASTDAGSLQV